MKASTLKRIMRLVMLGILWLTAACANGGYQTYQPPSSPSYNNYQEDPQFWPMWQDRQGGGG